MTDSSSAPVFYKAVDPNGFDFHTGTVDYASLCGTGTPLPELPHVPDPACCTGDVYHASVSPAETLIGGSWPCRLFEVTGIPVAEEDHKRGFFTMTVVREIEAWRALGPNGREVSALIERAGALTIAEATALGAARDAAWSAARDAAAALVVRDLITTEQFDTLYGPWASVIGTSDNA